MHVHCLPLAAFARRVLVAAAIVTLALLLWQIRTALLLAFAAVLVAILLRTAARPLARVGRLPDGWAIGLAAILLATGLGFVASLAGSEVGAQVADLTQRVPAAWERLQDQLADGSLDRLMERAERHAPDPSGLLASVTGFATSTIGLLVNLIVVVFGGLYLALQPRLYREGLLALAPARIRPQLAATLDASGRALRYWLLGQLLVMTLVATATTLGLWLLGLPGFLALGLLAGLAEFVPFVGPIAAAVPAILLAAALDTETLIWTVLLYLVIQQVESNVIMPLITRETVALPPAVTLFAIVAFGLVFGLPGILLATPLTVVAFVAVKKLWIRDALGGETDVPGEEEGRPAPAA